MKDKTHILPLLFIGICFPDEVGITWMRLKSGEFSFWMNSILGSKGSWKLSIEIVRNYGDISDILNGTSTNSPMVKYLYVVVRH